MLSFKTAWFLFFFASITHAASGSCPCGATYNAQFNKCYDFLPLSKTFLDAQQSCQNLDGQLVSIRNAFENALLIQGATDAFSADQIDFWSGGSDIALPGTWTWADGTAFNYTNWAAAAAPFVGYLPELSDVFIMPYNSKLPSDISADNTLIVQLRLLPQRAPHVRLLNWFALLNGPTTQTQTVVIGLYWGDAEATCQSMGAHLVSIHSDDENSFVGSIAEFGWTIHNGWTWTGLHSIVPGEWVWSDGTPLDFINWGPQQPNPDSSRVCAFLFADHYDDDDRFYHKWMNYQCDISYVRNYVCKKKANH